MASSETKVGILVLAGLAGLGWLGMNSGALGGSLGDGRRALNATFENAEGLLVGSAVKIAGVPVGDVTEIRLSPDGRATVHFTVKKDVPLAAQVQAQITTSGLIGEKFVSLKTPAGAQEPLPPEQHQIASAGVSAPEQITDNFADVASDLREITGSLRQALGGDKNAAKLQRIVEHIEGFSSRLDEEVPVGSIRAIMTDLQASTGALKELLSGGDGQQTGQMLANFSKTAENLAQITTRIEQGEGVLGQLLMGKDPNADGMFADLQASSQSLKEITGKINSGEGTLGKLVNDPAIADRLTSTLETFSSAASRLESFRTEVDLSAVGLMAEEGVSKGALQVTLRPNPQRYYVLGLTTDGLANSADSMETTNPYAGLNFGHEMKFTAQFGHMFENTLLGQNVGLRMGMKDSTGGVGLDTTVPLPFAGGLVQDEMQLALDAYDFSGENTNDSDSPHVDVRAKVGLNLLDNHLYTTFGYDNVLNQEYGSPFIGLGYRFQDDDLKYVVGSAL